MATKKLPTAYGVPTETLGYSYTRLGLPKTLGGTASSLIVDSPYSELLQYTMGTTSGKFGYQTNYLDEGTRRLQRNVVSNQAVSGSIVDATYAYDASGNVKSVSDTAGTDDLQCFTYDYRRQLRQAWTINTGACGTTPSTTVIGTTTGAYWTTYTYDALGNRKTEVDHAKAGAANDTTYTYTYPTPGATAYPNAATGAGGPHAVSGVSKKVGSAAATNTTYKYDAAGNMTTRGTYTHAWDNEGELATSKNGTAAASSNLYDADGNRIVRIDPDCTFGAHLDVFCGLYLWVLVPMGAVGWLLTFPYRIMRSVSMAKFLGWLDLNAISVCQSAMPRSWFPDRTVWVSLRSVEAFGHRVFRCEDGAAAQSSETDPIGLRPD